MTANDKRKVPEFFRESIEAAQARFEQFEKEAQRVVKDLVEKGRQGRAELAELAQKAAKLTQSDVTEQTGRLKEQGIERIHELRNRAENIRDEAVHRLQDVQHKAISALGVATKEQVEDLAKDLEKLAKKLDKLLSGKKPKALAKKAEA